MQKKQADMLKTTAIMQLCENFHAQPSDTLIDLWLSLSSDESPENFVQACRHVMKNFEYKTLPPYAVINRELKKIKGQDEESIEALAESAWANLLEAISRYGYTKKPKLQPYTAYAVHVMGEWDAVCTWSEKGLDFKKRDFLEHWKNAYNRPYIIENALHPSLRDKFKLTANAPQQLSDIINIPLNQLQSITE